MLLKDSENIKLKQRQSPEKSVNVKDDKIPNFYKKFAIPIQKISSNCPNCMKINEILIGKIFRTFPDEKKLQQLFEGLMISITQLNGSRDGKSDLKNDKIHQMSSPKNLNENKNSNIENHHRECNESSLSFETVVNHHKISSNYVIKENDSSMLSNERIKIALNNQIDNLERIRNKINLNLDSINICD